MAKFKELNYEMLEHPAYSPDLAPTDYYLYPNLKIFLAGKRFTSNDEAIAAVNGYFANLPESHFNDGIELLEKRWNVLKFQEILLKNETYFALKNFIFIVRPRTFQTATYIIK